MKLNNKGFSLVEVLAVLVILGIIAAIMIPASTRLISQNKEDNYKNLKKSILVATKDFITDHKYDIILNDNNACDENDPEAIRRISKIEYTDEDNKTVTIPKPEESTTLNSQLKIKYLINDGRLKEPIKNPKTGKEINTDKSYVTVFYSCKNKNYFYMCFDKDDKNCTYIDDENSISKLDDK